MRIKIKNLARIKEASIALKPFTVFIGKNNTNKSYVAHVFYALFDLMSVKWERNIEKKHIEEIARQLRPFLETSEEKQGEQVLYSFSFKKDKECLKQFIQIFKKIWIEIFPLYINNPTLKQVLIELEDFPYLFKKYQEISPKFSSLHKSDVDQIPSIIIFNFFRLSLIDFLSAYFGFKIPVQPFYFPASRTGFALALEDIISGIIRRLTGISVTKLTEPTIDFLKNYNDIKLERFHPERFRWNKKKREISPSFKKITSFFEKKLLNGKVILKKPMKEIEAYSKFVYKPQGVKAALEFHCVSSLVTELAPIYSFLTQLQDVKDTFFIIEEPESHLHPSAQLEMVKFLGMLVRNGAKVLITTHSDYILNFVNVLIRSSQLTEEERKNLKFKRKKLDLDRCFLKPEEVGCYLFKEKGKEVAVEEIEITEDGITTDCFEEILDEIVGISNKLDEIIFKRMLKNASG